MAYHLESDPHLYSPEYWGVDIQDPNYSQTHDHMAALLGKLRYKNAVQLLKNGLDEVIEGNYIEVIVNESEFNPSVNSLGDGTLVVARRERLVHYPGSAPAGWDWPGEPSPTLETPYAQHWADCSAAGLYGFGLEVAVFPKQQIRYNNAAKWGVMLSLGEQRIIKLWDLDQPFVAARQAFMLKTWRKNTRIAEFCPIQLDAPEIRLDTFGNNQQLRAIERYTDLRVVRTYASRDGNERQRRLLERVGKAAGNLGRTVLPAPSPVPVPI